MHKITRISYNSKDWRKPTGEAGKYEAIGTYNYVQGFGHEDWLFRTEWLISGWRYAFIQGVNKSHAKLVNEAQPFDITLFTIQPDKKRRFVATIIAVECLDDYQAENALKEFKRNGWYKAMQKEIEEAGGNISALGNTKWAKHILNVRFRQENVQHFDRDSYASSNDPIMSFNRYQLYDAEKINSTTNATSAHTRSGKTNPPKVQSFTRHTSVTIDCTPEHTRMQAKLMEELKSEYPGAHILREQGYIDVSVRTGQELILFEIKSDLEPKTVIRQALGQILEYAYYPSQKKYKLPVQLVIVGRQSLYPSDEIYLEYLKSEFSLPVSYRVVKL